MQDIWGKQRVFMYVCLWDAANRRQGKSGPLGQLRNNNKEASEVWMKALSWNISLLTVHTSMNVCSWTDWLTEAAARAHGILTTTNLGSSGYLNIVTFNIAEQSLNFCFSCGICQMFSWSCNSLVLLCHN